MNFKQAKEIFLRHNEPFSDYYALVRQWAVYVNDLHAKGRITDKQHLVWGNPCSPKSFKDFNSKFTGERYVFI